jgi:DNA-binding protein H-NS
MLASRFDLSSMSIDELWSLHEEIGVILSARIQEQKSELERRLVVLNHGSNGTETPKASRPAKDRKPRRKYPKVLPRYRNPETSETWSGRGKQPRWLLVAMESGHSMEEFRISE